MGGRGPLKTQHPKLKTPAVVPEPESVAVAVDRGALRRRWRYQAEARYRGCWSGALIAVAGCCRCHCGSVVNGTPVPCREGDEEQPRACGDVRCVGAMLRPARKIGWVVTLLTAMLSVSRSSAEVFRVPHVGSPVHVNGR